MRAGEPCTDACREISQGTHGVASLPRWGVRDTGDALLTCAWLSVASATFFLP